MNCSGLLPAGIVLAVVSTVPPPRTRRFTMASPIPLVPPVTRTRLPVNSFASYGMFDALIGKPPPLRSYCCSNESGGYQYRLYSTRFRCMPRRVGLFFLGAEIAPVIDTVARVLSDSAMFLLLVKLLYAGVPNGCRATSGYSRRYPRRTSCKDRPIRSRYAALPVRCPAFGRNETEAAAQCRIRRSPRRRFACSSTR